MLSITDVQFTGTNYRSVSIRVACLSCGEPTFDIGWWDPQRLEHVLCATCYGSTAQLFYDWWDQLLDQYSQVIADYRKTGNSHGLRVQKTEMPAPKGLRKRPQHKPMKYELCTQHTVKCKDWREHNFFHQEVCCFYCCEWCKLWCHDPVTDQVKAK